MRIIEAFEITGRGIAVLIDETTEMPVGKELAAIVMRPDGTALRAPAYKEWLLRRSPGPQEKEAFLLLGVTTADVPPGTELRLELPPT